MTRLSHGADRDFERIVGKRGMAAPDDLGARRARRRRLEVPRDPRLLMSPPREIDGVLGCRREEIVQHAAFERAETGRHDDRVRRLAVEQEIDARGVAGRQLHASNHRHLHCRLSATYQVDTPLRNIDILGDAIAGNPQRLNKILE